MKLLFHYKFIKITVYNIYCNFFYSIILFKRSTNVGNQQQRHHQPIGATTRTTNNTELQSILKSYGIEVDGELLEKSETSNLLVGFYCL